MKELFLIKELVLKSCYELKSYYERVVHPLSRGKPRGLNESSSKKCLSLDYFEINFTNSRKTIIICCIHIHSRQICQRV